jgi:anti-sigma factor RsiW
MARETKLRKKERAARDELLSVYLDDQLDAEERARLEIRLAGDAALRAELEALRRTVEMVRDLPSQPIPRNFILPQTIAPKPQRPPAARPRLRWAAPFLTAATAAVSLLFVVVLAGDLLLSGAAGMARAPGAAEQKLAAPSPAEGIAVEEAPAAPAPGETPPQVTDAERETLTVTALPKAMESTNAADSTPSPSPTPGSYGPATGGGEDKEEGGERAEATVQAAEPFPVAGGGATEGTVTPAPTAAPLAAEIAPAQTATPVPTPGPEEPLRSPAPAPSEENDMVPTAGVEELADGGGERAIHWGLAPQGISPWRILEIALGVVAVGMAVATVMAWRARRR